jgi:hypothetical protein
MAITLGRNCTVSVGGTVASARNVTFQMTAKTIDVQEFGKRESAVLATGWDSTVSIELNDAGDLGSILSNLQDGISVTVTGGAGGWSFEAIPVSISENDPIDGVATFNVECKLTRS